jgi:membrane-bound metal-dependent hydrolase YbcI (DUF457 family)
LDSEKHAILGALIAGGGYLGYKLSKKESPDLVEAIVSFVGGAIAGVAPDILEPANSPDHRSLCHSHTLLALITQGNRNVWRSENLKESQKVIASLLSAAYASHLIADGTTPKGLPLLV